MQRAPELNQWTKEEQLIQLASYLRGKALQEWNLIHLSEKSTLKSAVYALKDRLEPNIRTLAAQDFRHTIQNDGEPVSEYIRHVERPFVMAYGQDIMSTETREMLLHGQLQEGLSYDILKAPEISGALT